MNDEIDKVLEQLESDEDSVSTKDIEPIKKGEVDVTDPDDIAEELVRMVKDDRVKSDAIFDMFFPKLAQDKDRSTASKEALTKALELKIEASKNIIELLKIKAKVEESGNKLGILIGTMPAKRAGINMDEVRDVADE
tara:strand:- start:106 stop:516 length:411 start_codon:yes stop_codon:yes gene_type:complete